MGWGGAYEAILAQQMAAQAAAQQQAMYQRHAQAAADHANYPNTLDMVRQPDGSYSVPKAIA